MKLEQMGERGIIRKLGEIFGERAIEDDCAILHVGGSYYMLFTTDTVNQKEHIPFTATPWQIGYYACAVNLSDIAAKGGEPQGLLFATTYPKEMDMECVLEIARGMADCAGMYGAAVLGGDTKEGENLTIAGVGIGRVHRSMLMRRRGAKPGDAVYITGTVGRGGTAFVKLQHGYEQKNATKELLEITPRITLARQIARLGVVTSAIDTSDGMAAALQQLGELNSVGFQIVWDEKFPVYPDALRVASKFGIDPSDFIFYGGDYEILFTIDGSFSDEFEKKARKKKFPVTRIGRVTQGKSIALKQANGRTLDLTRYGYEHFHRKSQGPGKLKI
ncbi:MAG: thiamine-phosphate kinase [Thermoplasmata archaeon]|nr:thiamine-phosphate kinase [Thermoplasmata archaeon]